MSVESILRGAGLTDEPDKYDDSIHGWRCSHPDIYDRCSCFAELVAELESLIAARVATAWFEGAACRAQGDPSLTNPYIPEGRDPEEFHPKVIHPRYNASRVGGQINGQPIRDGGTP